MRLIPPASSMSLTMGFSGSPFSCCCALPTLRILARVSRATVIIFESCTPRRSQRGGMQPFSTKYSIWAGLPPAVALLKTQAASRLMSKSAVWRSSKTSGIRFALMTSWICALVPAVMFEMVQQDSFRMLFFVCVKSPCNAWRTPHWRTAWVCVSSPVTMFPTARSAGVWTKEELWASNSTKRVQTPDARTALMRSLAPSVR
mmetsp:Transcript_95410/g.199622  ORF Transcript_95410/g.199622 Transcript_95410/m.199622 type:complete len:202 (-) Transcript_95410:975-1580(-)